MGLFIEMNGISLKNTSPDTVFQGKIPERLSNGPRDKKPPTTASPLPFVPHAISRTARGRSREKDRNRL